MFILFECFFLEFEGVCVFIVIRSFVLVWFMSLYECVWGCKGLLMLFLLVICMYVMIVILILVVLLIVVIVFVMSFIFEIFLGGFGFKIVLLCEFEKMMLEGGLFVFKI